METTQSRTGLIVFIFLTRCELLLDVTSAETNAPEKVNTAAAVKLKERPGCRDQVLPPALPEWRQPGGSLISIEWVYGKRDTICDSVNGCFHLSLQPDVNLPPQLTPLILQAGEQLKFFAGKAGTDNFTMKPYRVSEAAFHSCNTEGGQAVSETYTSDVITVKPELLQPGSNYFIAASNTPIMHCKFGLRLNVTVKEHSCRRPGEPAICWNKGRCLTDYFMNGFECSCCHGFTGPTCDDVDACASDPCNNGGTCLDVRGDLTGKLHQCTCPVGWTGEACDTELESQCLSEPCEHNGTCMGDKKSFHCACPAGWTGSHCEVNINECASNPCVNGVCVDKEGGYQCFCIPGHGGSNCEIEYNECQSSPCRNSGFCVDKEDGWECHCGMGYTGDDCSLKIDLCSPSPCENATECVDYGNYFSCTCNPGFQGSHCEININECASNPCQNFGHCYDLIAAYRCVCRPGTSGDHCQHISHPQMPKPLNSHGPLVYPKLHHRTHLQNLLIVAGTLTGALLIALAVLAGCYCRFYGPRTILTCRQFKYKKQKDLSEPQENTARSTASPARPRPTTEAIIEASSSGATYRENTLSAPLMHSLKPKRV